MYRPNLWVMWCTEVHKLTESTSRVELCEEHHNVGSMHTLVEGVSLIFSVFSYMSDAIGFPSARPSIGRVDPRATGEAHKHGQGESSLMVKVEIVEPNLAKLT